jgi:hypothetical protein
MEFWKKSVIDCE